MGNSPFIRHLDHTCPTCYVGRLPWAHCPRCMTGGPAGASHPSMGLTKIVVRGARQHNLENINLEIPRDTLAGTPAFSGSGKSSPAFDTLYAEGQCRDVESLSAYARQLLDQMERPDV